MAIAYWTVAGITFSIILSAFLRDHATPKISLKAWAFIATATLLWPVTLPFIISSKLRAANAQQQANAEERNPPPTQSLKIPSSEGQGWVSEESHHAA